MRDAGTVLKERMRAPAGVRYERRRASGSTLFEQMLDQYVRLHPPAPGCTIYTIQGVAGLGTAGCAVAGLDMGYRP